MQVKEPPAAARCASDSPQVTSQTGSSPRKRCRAAYEACPEDVLAVKKAGPCQSLPEEVGPSFRPLVEASRGYALPPSHGFLSTQDKSPSQPG